MPEVMVVTGDETLPADASIVAATSRSPVELAAGDRVGRYFVRRLLGSGGMGNVYLARDMVLGRSVVLKVVRAQTKNTQQLIEEAQTTARFSHPHIVQLYDVGEHRGVPYLALEYLEGESLRERTRREWPSLDEAIRIARAIADAVAHAHAVGVLHCDLKPSNIVLPADGRLRVVDFGLASTMGDVGLGGTPDWMAPEQWLGQRLTDRTDVWALGVLVHELVAHEHPFGPVASREERRAVVLDARVSPRPLDAAVPAPLAEALRRSLSRDPEERPRAAEFLHALDEAADVRVPKAAGGAPYRGLAAFDASHAHLFFGRESDLDAFVEELRGKPQIAVVGPSGSGKSSFVHASVVPRLRADGWRAITVRPGAEPFMVLAACLLEGTGAARSEVVETAASLRATPTLLAVRLQTLSADHRVVLVIDQLEELFTHGAPEADVRCFVDMLDGACDDPRDPVRLIMTLRDDFIGRLASLRSVHVLRRLDGADLRRTITAPLDGTGYRFEEPAIVDDMLGETASLPLLQFACRLLWDMRDTEARTLTRQGYRDLGGVAGALARHADAFIDALSPADQATARTLLLRLVAGTDTRRSLARGSVLVELPASAELVLDRLVDARLVTQRRVEGEDALLVELAHESMIASWPRLARWLEETGDARRLLDELDAAETLWERRGFPVDGTWSAAEVANARTRAAQTNLVLPPRLERFLATGEARHARARRRRTISVGIGVALAAVVTVGSLALAHTFREQRIAAQRARGNLGRSVLVLTPFDLRDGAVTSVSARELPHLRWKLYAVDHANVHREGVPLPDALVDTRLVEHGDALISEVEAPGGTAFLAIEGRGREGETCARSWVRLQGLPGYASRDAATQIEIMVPTCQASAADTIAIPAGPVIYGGPGTPPTKFAEYVETEREVPVAAFRIDRYEVSNRRFAPFAAMSKVTGYANPVYPTNDLFVSAHAPDSPVSAIDAFEAEAFCRYMGKRLPGDHEWTKAARGGVEVDGAANASPRRLYPWGEQFARSCVNAEGADDGFPWLAPVGSFPCGRSVYGVDDLAGNVAEWISREGQAEQQPLRIARGGAADSPVALEQVTTVFRNSREDRQFDLSIGVRCATD